MDAKTVLNILEHEFPNHESELDFSNEFELLIAVMLSAQTTDVAVNKVTPDLFLNYPNAYAMSQATPAQIEPFIKTIGLYRNKAKFAVETSKRLVEVFDGKVPNNRRDLMSLPGVGRKTANVVLAVGFDIPAIAVDTHVERVAKRLGWADSSDSVIVVEQKLMEKLDPSDWGKGHHLLLLFGRYISTARNQEDAYVLLEELKEKHNL